MYLVFATSKRDSEVTFADFESNCYLLLPV